MSSFVKINLNSQCNDQELSVFHVKLTDSALRSFETYNQKKMKYASKIQFDKNQGTIQVPADSLNNKDSFKNFSFTLATVAETKDGSTECLVQTNRSPSLTNIGSIYQKITVHASDDVYQNTLEKMSIVESESKKNCVKEIKLKSHENLARLKAKHALSTFPQSNKMSFVSNVLNNRMKSSYNDSKKSESLDMNYPSRVNSRSLPAGKRAPPDTIHNSPALSPCKNSPALSHKNDSPNESILETYPSLPKKNRVAHDSKKNGNLAQDPPALIISDSRSELEEDDLLKLYPKIESDRIRNKYKKIFNKDYEIYLQLHHSVQQRLTQINSLLEKLKLEIIDSINYKNTFEKILEEHAILLNNEQHTFERNRCNNYHKKLTHLKTLVEEYDARDLKVYS